MDTEVIKRIAELEYGLFVVNTHAAAIQQENGAYLTKYFPLTALTIERMILSRGSMGCYQQEYKAGHIRWICLDFDCVDKQSPDVIGLYKEVICPLSSILSEHNISFLTEFSGRRGIHVWIVFDTVFSKKVGFQIIQSLCRLLQERIDYNKDEKWNLDKFPATDSSRGNIVGKQVKFPFSRHKAGALSFFVEREEDIYCNNESNDFWNKQLQILEEYRLNSVGSVLQALQIVEDPVVYQARYRKYRILDTIEASTSDIRRILSKTKVYCDIFSRMQRGQAMSVDWTVLMGTLSRCDPNADLLKQILSEYPNFGEEKTLFNLRKLKNMYYPASFGYLYTIYNLPIEPEIDPNETGFHFLVRELGIDEQVVELPLDISERTAVLSIEDTVNKEKKYLLYNDEAPDISIWNQLLLLNRIDYESMERQITCLLHGSRFESDFVGLRKYYRIESAEKTRCLISLSARDRVITTNLALRLCLLLQNQWNSFSYRPALTSRGDIFYAWYYSWGRYTNQIKAFFEVPFFSDYQALYIDLKSFYDNIDFLAAYRTLEGDLNDEANAIFNCLIDYNDCLMAHLNNGKRIGVPQGPAYARIIAEIYLDKIMEQVLPQEDRKRIHVFRYVDDITIICEPSVDGNQLFRDLKQAFLAVGLPVNSEKSRFFGLIGSLTKQERNTLIHANNFNYDLRYNKSSEFLSRSDRNRKLQAYLNEHPFSIDSLGYIFGGHTITEAQLRCFASYRREIFASRLGRGSNFKKFYRFLFQHSDFLELVLDNKELLCIPSDSLNFSNYICQLYLSHQRGEIAPGLFLRICREQLRQIDHSGINPQDRIVLDTLFLLAGEDRL